MVVRKNGCPKSIKMNTDKNLFKSQTWPSTAGFMNLTFFNQDYDLMKHFILGFILIIISFYAPTRKRWPRQRWRIRRFIFVFIRFIFVFGTSIPLFHGRSFFQSVYFRFKLSAWRFDFRSVGTNHHFEPNAYWANGCLPNGHLTNLESNHADVAPTDQSDAVFIITSWPNHFSQITPRFSAQRQHQKPKGKKRQSALAKRLISHLDLSRRDQLIVLTV